MPRIQIQYTLKSRYLDMILQKLPHNTRISITVICRAYVCPD